MSVETVSMMDTTMYRSFMLAGALAFTLGLTACTPAQTHAQDAPAAAAPKPLPAGGVSLLPADPFTALKITGQADIANAEPVAVSGQPFKTAVRLRSTRRPEQVYSAQIAGPPTGAVKKGDTLLATFYVRTVQGQPETGEARTEFVFERNSDPYTKSVQQEISIPAKGWKRFDIPFKAAEDLAANQATVSFRLGYAPQVFELGGITLTNFGPSVALKDLPRTAATYIGQEPNAKWRRDAEARIEKIRKADMTVRVVDAAGKPVSGATVAVRMKRHAFPFGSAVAAEELLADTPDAKRYQEMVPKLFNQVVMENDLKWDQWLQNRQRSIQGVAWLRERGVEVRGHNLVWPAWKWLPNQIEGLKGDKAALDKAVTDHITDEVTAMKGQLVDWDVINEPFANHDLMDILGQDAMIRWFKLARAADPKPVLYLNDYPPLDGGDPGNPHLNHFEKTIKYLIDGGAPLGGIGFQCHFGGNVIPPTRVLSGLDRFAKFKKPILITEFDINTADEDMQADYTRDFMTAAFSHPAVSGVIMWGFWEGRHWIPNAALYRRDWSAKPNGQAWVDLVQKKWWTSADGRSDRSGSYRVRGFKGDYEVTATANGKTKTVPAQLATDGATVTVALP